MKKITENTMNIDSLETTLETAYGKYATMVIEDRALPDARDGLKPSQRRILVAMNDLNLWNDKKHLKCAKICGDTSGNYHPHGESVIFPTLVSMAQDFNFLNPLIDPQGNFGSVDGDPSAAMRYVEARLSKSGVEMIRDLNPYTVDYKPNFDERLSEPVILPTRIPNLLLNGSSGIAVGYATNMLSHNYTEISNLIKSYIQNPNLTTEEILKIVPGPDFPTGGIVCGQNGIKSYYETGKGSLEVEGKYEVLTDSKGRESIVITEFPPGGSPETFRKEIKNLVDDEKISGISDCLNFSSRKIGTKVVVEIGKNSRAKIVLNNLLKYTCLRKTLSVNNTVLVDGKLHEKVSLIFLVKTFVEFRKSVLTKKFNHEIDDLSKRIEILEGLLSVIPKIDETVKIIRNSSNPTEAEKNLLHKRIVKTETQAKAVLALTLSKITKLEETSLSDEKKVKEKKKSELESLVKDSGKMNKFIIDEQTELSANLASSRKTKITQSGVGILSDDELIEEKKNVIILDSSNYIKRVSTEKYNNSSRGGKGGKGSELEESSRINSALIASTHDNLYVFSSTGKMHKIKVYDLPECDKSGKGQPITNFVDLDDNEKVCALLGLRTASKDDYLIFSTQKGLVKRTEASSYTDLYNGCIATKLTENDSLVDVSLCKENDDIVMITKDGMSIRYSVSDVRPTARNTQGCCGIKLDKNDILVSSIIIETEKKNDKYITKNKESSILTITENGYGKRTDVDEYLKSENVFGEQERQSRGGKGKLNLKISDKTGSSVDAILFSKDDDVLVYTSKGKTVRIEENEIRTVGRNSQGVRLVKLDSDTVVSASRIVKE